MSDDRAERVERLKTVASEMDRIVREIGPKWIRLAHLREELAQILQEIGDVQTDRR